MKAPPAGEREDRFGDLAALALDLGLGLLERRRIQDDERATGAVRRHLGEAALQVAVGERDVVGTVVGERPAEHRGVERLRGRDVGRGQLDVINAVVMVFHA